MTKTEIFSLFLDGKSERRRGISFLSKSGLPFGLFQNLILFGHFAVMKHFAIKEKVGLFAFSILKEILSLKASLVNVFTRIRSF